MTQSLSALIVEDSEAERFFLRRMILKCRPDWRVFAFAYAEDALAFLGDTGNPWPCAIFADINMPRMDGFQFANAFTALPRRQGRRSGFWLVSHSIDPLDREQAEAHPGITGFMPKTYKQRDVDRLLCLVEGA